MNNWMDVEHYTSKKKIYRDNLKSPFVTLVKAALSNKAVFSSGFVATYKENFPENAWMLLSFSRANNAIILRIIDKSEWKPGAKRINIKVRQPAISLTPFLCDFGIDIKKYSGRYIPEVQDIPGIGKAFIIFLDRKIRAED